MVATKDGLVLEIIYNYFVLEMLWGNEWVFYLWHRKMATTAMLYNGQNKVVLKVVKVIHQGTSPFQNVRVSSRSWHICVLRGNEVGCDSNHDMLCDQPVASSAQDKAQG